MNTDELRDALVRAVPPLTTPPHRMAEVSRRIARRRTRRVTLNVVGAAVAAALVVGTPMVLSLGADHVGRLDIAVADGPGPTPGADDAPPSRAGTVRCPASLDLMSRPPAVRTAESDADVALPLKQVTLCRYRHASFDTSVGDATRRSGPRDGVPGQFATPLSQYLRQRIWNPPSASAGAPDPSGSPPTGGCRYPSPTSNVAVDVVYTVDAGRVAREYRLYRVTCAPGSDPDPARQLEAAVDRVLGPPY